ncbi:magnesium-translocating P-type ATPase [Streptantibioticus parmotrematis]|uniref:magnesium-translocating P-type ATPase n=1 Tax=Streptantibioticus parmotrematis TaxID=2873249 RepID=UPI0027DEE0FC|nr:magnesium-translocating P-type ATPase [Streptantibioticus parmotrematis]
MNERAGASVVGVLRGLGSRPRGLTEGEAAERLAWAGENVVRPLPAPGWAPRLLRAARDPFTGVLFGLGVVSALDRAWGTAGVILVLVGVSCVLRAWGEMRADRAAAALGRLVPSTATVRRRATESCAPLAREVPVEEIVPGDVVQLAPGDVVPADVRLLRSRGFTVHQAALTGESAPVPKSPDAADDDGRLCFAGSDVASGTASGVVTATGAGTVLAATGEPPRRRTTAFGRAVNGVSWTLVRIMALAVPVVLAVNAAVRGRGWETLPFAVAVAVGLTPEMLPVVVTAAFVRGARDLAHDDGVIVKRLPALHDLGAMDVLCTDKTGTLTCGTLVVDAAAGDRDAVAWAALGSRWLLDGSDGLGLDAVDEALLAHPSDVPEPLSPGHSCVDVLPFTPARRLSTVVLARPDRPGTRMLVVKGAVEDVLARCAVDEPEREALRRRADALAGGGLRVLAVATAERPSRGRPFTSADERGLTPHGLVALRDETAPGARAALAALTAAGVEVKVLTGDHPGTAARVCRDLGLDLGPGAWDVPDAACARVLTGDRVDTLDDEALAELASRAILFARCTPAHKARVVDALRRAGRVAGYLGDGVNDLPALRAADVGVSPRDGADAARAAADVVLAAKDLTSIGTAVAAGRRATGNIATYLRVAVSSNLGNVISMLVAGVLLPFLPMLPAQVLAQNLCFDAAQLAFAYDRPGPSVLRRPARLRPEAFTRFVTLYGVFNAAADLATFGVLAVVASGERAFHAGWFTENLITQAMIMVMLRSGSAWGTGAGTGGGTGPGERTALPRPLRIAVAALAAIGLLLPLSPLAAPLRLRALPPLYYGLLAVVLAAYGAGLALACRHRSRRRHAP